MKTELGLKNSPDVVLSNMNPILDILSKDKRAFPPLIDKDSFVDIYSERGKKVMKLCIPYCHKLFDVFNEAIRLGFILYYPEGDNMVVPYKDKKGCGDFLIIKNE